MRESQQAAAEAPADVSLAVGISTDVLLLSCFNERLQLKLGGDVVKMDRSADLQGGEKLGSKFSFEMPVHQILIFCLCVNLHTFSFVLRYHLQLPLLVCPRRNQNLQVIKASSWPSTKDLGQIFSRVIVSLTLRIRKFNQCSVNQIKINES